MKKNVLSLAALALAGSMTFSSCIGSYGLLNKFCSWEMNATGNHFVNGILGIILLPVAGICGAVDTIVLNTIEFWTGTHPVASNIGKTQNIMGEDGLMYAVKTLKNGYEITKPDGQVVMFTYNKKENAWYMDGTQLVKFNENGTVQANLMNGKTITVTQDAQGPYEARMAAGNGYFFAAR